ncbi:MAG TPA: LCP family protein [Candidatus Saccharimonadales bacterium]|nr:LCP family protein [Candidatus Saccharimonadales bacterium]
MKHKNGPRLIDDFVARPGSGSVSGHPDASRFPNVGMTFNSYNRTAAPPGAPLRPLSVAPPQPAARSVLSDSGSQRLRGASPALEKEVVAAPIQPRQASAPARQSRWQRLRSKLSWKRALVTLGVLLLLFIGWFGFKFFYNLSKTFHGNVFGLFNSTTLKGESTGRVNVLLAGNSADDPGHDGGNLTDSIMILSLDVKNHTAFMVSVPRDLYVTLPSAADPDANGYGRINQAILDSSFSEPGYPKGGMGLLEQIVQENFGITLDYYALINYGALRDAVNAVGGINVTIKSCDSRGLYDPNRDYVTGGPLVNLTNGTHRLNGEQALDLARARGDPNPYGVPYGFCNSDFTRTENQRMMILALKDKVMSASVLANPLKLASLFDTLGKNVRTDMSLSEAHRFYDITKQIKSSSIKSVGLNDANGKDLLANYKAPSGASTLIPAAGINDYSQIQLLMKQLTSSDPIVREDASVVLLNASDTYGLAASNKTKLTQKNVNVTTVGDAPQTRSQTIIVDASNGKKPSTLALLKSIYGSSVTTTNPYATQYPDADIIVVLGQDQSLQQQ